MDLDEQEHQGNVKSRTHATCYVAEPVEITLEGRATSLTLEDAKRLQAGLAAAIERVEANETALANKAGELGHTYVFGTTRSGMSFASPLLRTKLGQGGYIPFFSGGGYAGAGQTCAVGTVPGRPNE